VLEGKRLFGALYGVYSITLSELKPVLQDTAVKKRPPVATTAAPTAQENGEFREQNKMKWVNSSERDRPGSIKKQDKTTPVLKEAPKTTSPRCRQ
jgi:hypothetical protein